MINWLSNLISPFRRGSTFSVVDSGRSSSGITVTADDMLAHSSVHQAVYVIASGFAGVQINVVKYLPSGGKVIDWDHPLQELIAVQPNEEMTARQMRETVAVHLLTRGNAYIYKVFNGYNMPVALYLLDPSIVSVMYDPDGTKYFMVAGQRVERREIIHVAAMSSNGVTGISPISHLKNLVGVAKALDEYSGSFFANGCNSRGILTTPDELTDLAYKRLKRDFKKRHQGLKNANEPMLLEQGLTYTPTSITPNECQFNETQKLLMLRVAAAFNLPPTKLGIYDHTALNTLEESNLDFFNSTLLPHVDRYTDALTSGLLTTPAERKINGIEYAEGAALRGRMEDRVKVWQMLKTMGAINTNEIRAELGLAPIKDGDVYMVQANNYQPLSQVVSPRDDNSNMDGNK